MLTVFFFLILQIQQILQAEAVYISVDLIFQPFPEGQGVAKAHPIAFMPFPGQAGHRGQFALRGPQNFAHGIIRRGTGQPIAAAFAQRAFHQSAFAQRRHDAFQILSGNLLPLGHIAQADEAIVLLLGHVQHHPQGIPSL